jgi:ACS family tartrate transporter-like MFS transporter
MSEPQTGRAAVAPLNEDLLEQQVMWKVSLRLLPFLFVLYMVNILDRGNVGFAKLKMLSALGMDERDFGRAVGLFNIGYFLFEVPSNLLLQRIGARRWISRIMISWGLISAAMMFVTGPSSLGFSRFLLGVAEAGFFPGMILYLSYWYPARQRARAVSRFMTGSAVTGVLGQPLSGALLQYLDGVAGLEGWQWVFLAEGLPAVFLGVLVLFVLTDRPEQADWLAPAERDWLAGRMAREEKHRQTRHGMRMLRAALSPRVGLLCVIYFAVSVGSYAFGLYSPSIIEGRFEGAQPFEVGLLGALPNLAAVVAMVLVGAHSDRTGERRWHVAVPAVVGGAGWLLVAGADNPWLALVGLALAQGGMMSMLAPFWSLPTSYLSGTAAAGGIALINSVGNLGGWFAPNLFGEIAARTGRYTDAILIGGAILAAGGLLALFARHEPAAET